MNVSLYMSICEIVQFANIPGELLSSEDSLLYHVGPNSRQSLSSPKYLRLSELPMKAVYSYSLNTMTEMLKYVSICLRGGFLILLYFHCCFSFFMFHFHLLSLGCFMIVLSKSNLGFEQFCGF